MTQSLDTWRRRPGAARAAFIILGQVLVYRLRRLEMANWVAVVAILAALRTPLDDFLVRALFAGVLNLLAYTTNDYCDLERDLASGRNPRATEFLRDHRPAALAAQWGLVAGLGLLAWVWDPELLLAGALGAGICWIYTARFKAVPYADVLAMTAWGMAMTLPAISLNSEMGWALVVQMGLFSSVFETIQVLRDRREDAAISVATTAVVLGERRALFLLRGLMVLASLYGACVVQSYLGLIPLAAVLLPWRSDDVARYWTRVRLIFGVGWLAQLGWVWLNGSLGGWLW